MTHFNKKTRKAMAIVGLTTFGLNAMAPVLPVLADDATPEEKTYQKVGTPDYKAVDQKINDAKKQGMSIDVKEKIVKVSNKAEYVKAMKQAEDTLKSETVTLDKNINAYQEWVSESTGMDGLKPNEIDQQLLINKSPKATMTVSGISKQIDSKLIKPDQYADKINASAPKVIESKSAQSFQAKDNNGFKGEIATVTYENVDAKYGDEKIEKIVYKYHDLGANTVREQDKAPRFFAFQDPTDTVWYRNTEGVSIEPHFYNKAGQEITFKNNTAFMTVGSLNARYSETKSFDKLTKKGPAYHVEAVKAEQGATLHKLSGSSITIQDGNDAYGLQTNESNSQTIADKVIPSKLEGWDSPTDPKRIYGATALSMDNADQDTRIRFHIIGNESWSGSVWGTTSTSIAPGLPAPTGKLTKTKVVWDVEAPKAPVKAQVDADGNVVTDNNVNINDKLSYGLTAKIPEVDAKGEDIKSLTIVDPLEDVFKFESGVVKLNDAKGEDITDDGKLEFVEGTGVVWTPKDATKYAGKQVYIQLEVSVKTDADLSKYERDGQLVFPNSVYMTINGEKVPGNEVTVVPVGETTPIVKKVVVDNWDKVLADSEKNTEETKPDDANKDAAETKPEKDDGKKERATSDKKDDAPTSETPEVAAETKSDVDTATNVETPLVKQGQHFGYVLTTKIDVMNEDGQVTDSFKLVDNLEKVLAVDDVQVIDKTAGDDITKDFTQADNITMTLNSDKLKDYRGHEVEWRIGVHIDENADLSGYKQDDGSYLIKNVGSKVQNDKTTESHEVDVTLNKEPEPKPEEPKEVKSAPKTGMEMPATALWNWVKGVFAQSF